MTLLKQALKRNVVLERVYPYPVQKVWQALSDRKAMASWFMESDFQPQVGHKFQFHTTPRPTFDFDGIVNCEVLEIDEPHRLSYSWQGGRMVRPSIVIWTLSATEHGTHLRLEHNGFETIGGLSLSLLLGAGWKKILRKKLPDWIEKQATFSYQ